MGVWGKQSFPHVREREEEALPAAPWGETGELTMTERE